MITVSAPGKIHFLGEHTAVYGKPALLAAIDKRVTVDLLPDDGNRNVHIISKNFKTEITLSVTDILDITREAQKKWNEYRETNDIKILKSIKSNALMYPAIVIGETLMHFQQNLNEGFHLSIDSDIQIGSGIGSSAAVSASVSAAVARHLGESTKKEVVSEIAIRAERIKHGRPSYGDVAAVINGGLIWFRKETEDMLIIKLLNITVPEAFIKNFLFIQSGIPVESTGEMVHKVRVFKQQQPEVFAAITEDQERLTRDLLGILKQADNTRLAETIRAGEKNLETLGVVSPSARDLIRRIEELGGTAKICGAGGKEKGSGIILAYHSDRAVLEKIAKDKDLASYPVQLGGEGLMIE